MILYLGILLLQITCIVHVIKTGRNQLWIMALFALPVVSALAYLVIEVLPGHRTNRHVRAAQSAVITRLDPEREVRAARDALDLADTAANRIRLADALADVGRHYDAIPLYRDALTKGGGDARTRAKLAAALFETGLSDEALEIVDALDPASGQSEADRRLLLRARILDHLGRKDEAARIYADIVTRLPGEEARCRYAALLLEQGREGRARDLLEEVESRMKRLDRGQRAAEAEMYRWASETLAGMRAKSSV